MLNNSILIRRTGTVKAHLEILVINHHMVKGKFQIGEHRELPLSVRGVFQLHVPQLHRIVHGHHQRLAGLDSLITALIHRIAHTMAAGIFPCVQRLSHRLPGNAPVISVFCIPQIHIVARTVHGHRISPESGNPVIFRRLVKQIASGCVVYYHAHVPEAQIICPGYGQIHPVNYIFSFFIVKMSILHKNTFPFPLLLFYNTLKVLLTP